MSHAFFRQSSAPERPRGRFDFGNSWFSIVTLTLKKLIVSAKWKKYLASRQKSQAAANARFLAHRKIRSKERNRRVRRRLPKATIRVLAPKVFSFISNPEGVIQFIQSVRETSVSSNVFVDLEHVHGMTPDAAAVLLAMVQHCRIVGVNMSGNAPLESESREILNNSGFRSHVRSAPGFRATAASGRIGKFAKSRETESNRYSQELALEMIQFATLQLTGTVQHNWPSYSVLGEAMLNTLNHAAKKGEPKEPWWASVYHDAKRRRACFTFLDQGVGIFKSHTLTANLKFKQLVGLLDPAQLLEKLLKGEIPSSTRIAGRGNGLPEMYESCKAGRIRNLRVIANQAYGDAELDRYFVLSSSFEGTFLYWEIE